MWGRLTTCGRLAIGPPLDHKQRLQYELLAEIGAEGATGSGLPTIANPPQVVNLPHINALPLDSTPAPPHALWQRGARMRSRRALGHAEHPLNGFEIHFLDVG